VLPNLFVGTLTLESVLKAVNSGITADEIISYLETHAHPNISHRVPTVPEVRSAGWVGRRGGEGRGGEDHHGATANTFSPSSLPSPLNGVQVVTDQVRLWEAETMRVRYLPAYLYENFESARLYRASVEYARSQGHLLWSDGKAFSARESGEGCHRALLLSLGPALLPDTCMFLHCCPVLIMDCRPRSNPHLHQDHEGADAGRGR
jgi:transcription initiation factor TFIIH subunit 4